MPSWLQGKWPLVAFMGLVFAAIVITQIVSLERRTPRNACVQPEDRGCIELAERIAQSIETQKGLKGEKGLEGLKGLRGPRGFTGSPGDDGIRGPRGFRGFAGRQGPRGVPGANGQNGGRGIPGNNGRNGQNGARGVQGAPGANGAPGVNGPNGNQGPGGGVGAPGNPGQIITVPGQGQVIAIPIPTIPGLPAQLPAGTQVERRPDGEIRITLPNGQRFRVAPNGTVRAG